MPTNKPLPIIDADSKYFWEQCQKEILMIPYCLDCNQYHFYPRIFCPNCMSSRIQWKESTGRGKIYSFTIARRAGGPAFKDDVPYVVAIIELVEGVRMMSHIINTDIDNIKCDMAVQVIFEKANEEITLPKFTVVL